MNTTEDNQEEHLIRSKKRVQLFYDSDSDSSKESNLTEDNVKEVRSPSKQISRAESDDSNDRSASKKLPYKPGLLKVSDDSSSDSDTKDSSSKIDLNKERNSKENSDESNDISSPKRVPHKSRIQRVTDDSDSDFNAKDPVSKIPVKNEEQPSRIKNKKDKLKDKFKSLISSRGKEAGLAKDSSSENDNKGKQLLNNESEKSDEEISTITKLKEKIKERTIQLKMSICDPDTSDEESTPKEMQRPKKSRKSTKMTSPKPLRMSAKQAMENMQKIKSESNRMLREKEVSLPYHRPKALSLKDIMSRRKPAVSADGKVLPIKMNEEQLRQYSLLLEQRQKEMMELCKSESEEEEVHEKDSNLSNDMIPETVNNTKSTETNNELNEEEITFLNDSLYDDLCKTNIGTEIDTSDLVNNVKENKCTNIEMTELVNEKPTVEEPRNDNINGTIAERTAEGLIADDVNISKVSNTDETTLNVIEKDSVSNEKTQEEDEDGNASAEMSLVYNDSVEESAIDTEIENTTKDIAKSSNEDSNPHPIDNYGNVYINVEHSEQTACNEQESQLISLHYDTEKFNTEEFKESIDKASNNKIVTEEPRVNADNFSDDDMNVEDIDKLIEEAEIIQGHSMGDYSDSPMIIKDSDSMKIKPKLTGRPGMVIDLDGTDACGAKKLSGVELLKQRFTYFARLKTPEELEREREKKIKPGTQHIKLKQELEEKIAEQRSLEWSKRLEEIKQQKMEMDAVMGEEEIDDIDKIEAELEEKEEIESSEGEEEPELEDDIEIKDKPRKRNPMVADEAEESDDEVVEGAESGEENEEANEDIGTEADVEDDDDDDDEESEESSADELEDEQQSKIKKGRILKAFEDSDDEETIAKTDKISNTNSANSKARIAIDNSAQENTGDKADSLEMKESQDDDLQLAQKDKSYSEDLFTSQESSLVSASEKIANKSSGSINEVKDLGTQTFSILDSEKAISELKLPEPDKSTLECDTQSFKGDLDAVVGGMCSGSLSQNLVTSLCPTSSQITQPPIGEDLLALCTGQFYDNKFVSQLDNTTSQEKNDHISQIDTYRESLDQPPIGEDLLALCTGQFYDGKFVSQLDNTTSQEKIDHISQIDMHKKSVDQSKDDLIKDDSVEVPKEIINNVPCEIIELKTNEEQTIEDADSISQQNKTVDALQNKHIKTQLKPEDNSLLKSLLKELDDPEHDLPKPKKFFVGNDSDGKENKQNIANSLMKKRFMIDSDDEENAGAGESATKKKKIKKKKLKDRALQISDDEEEEEELYGEEYTSDIEEDDDTERIVEYDSEENEVEVVPQQLKKKRKASDFFEQEAELTSEDEWAGSGDEDERGLDRMEREEGDDETFNQTRLQRELGQIHMRDVLDQDKREVRLIQELLFEDGDLGGGSRQRKFKWRNADGEEESGTLHDELADTQEEEFESEEQWRKQRHEREMFLKQMQEKDEESNLNKSVNRTTIIKANLCSKTMSSLLMEVNTSKTEAETPPAEKKTSKDIPSPKKPFAIFQQNYHGTLLTRGRGALARLAALATPLAVDDEAPKGSLAPSTKRNFVFATLTPDEEPKVSKRKADAKTVTPRLVKKMRTEDKQKQPRASLLDHF